MFEQLKALKKPPYGGYFQLVTLTGFEPVNVALRGQ